MVPGRGLRSAALTGGCRAPGDGPEDPGPGGCGCDGRTPVAIDAPAADFRLRDGDGREHRLADYRGAWLLLVFHRHLR